MIGSNRGECNSILGSAAVYCSCGFRGLELRGDEIYFAYCDLDGQGLISEWGWLWYTMVGQFVCYTVVYRAQRGFASDQLFTGAKMLLTLLLFYGGDNKY